MEGDSCDLTNLDLGGWGDEEGGLVRELVGECLQFVQQFWEGVWYN